ncbi:MAG: hypothetical protein C0473_00560 [Cyanobacteria bacterium DS3.002]|nr:hypothetical protein [Cyanobacteria bacterium DS3.002]MBA4049450.1 hypothetical protein [Cyanobacteria bacterium DS2.008]
METLSDFFTLRRRYNRSINLERDLSNSNSVEGYVLTPRSTDVLLRIFTSFASQQGTRAWTLTGAYGTGKSSFAHFLACLCGPEDSESRKMAEKIGKVTLADSWEVPECLIQEKGFVRAIATAQREPLEHTILRALQAGASSYWAEGRGRKPDVIEQLDSALIKVRKGKTVAPADVLELVKETAKAAKTGLLLIIDELGKNLEYASQHSASSDLYLLQQLAELPADGSQKVFTLGILHEAFAEYAHGLTTSQRNEWVKVQGRFEDIPFTGSTNEMVRLMAHAIDRSQSTKLTKSVKEWSIKWFDFVKPTLATAFGDATTIASVYPLHPVTAALLPVLCSKFGQNDRSLFTFLTSDEPNSLPSFLSETKSSAVLPTIRLERVYDYWIDAAGSSLYSKPQLQRWVEIQGKVADATHLEPSLLALLKTIGLLNLVSAGGHLRATRTLVEHCMCDEPGDKAQLAHWHKLVDQLIEKRLVIFRSQLDELRIWEGSDFDIEPTIQNVIQTHQLSFEEMLTAIKPLGPVVVQRHSYTTGTLRYFERQYASKPADLTGARTRNQDSDGLILYWLGAKPPTQVPEMTQDDKPLIVVAASDISGLVQTCEELWALKKISMDSPELRTDGVARREVRQRLVYAQRLLDSALSNCFALDGKNRAWFIGKADKVNSSAQFASKLSDICDNIYSETPVLWNEIVNRRELTSQGAKARKELISAMLNNSHLERLGLVGFGPEFSMYASVLEHTGIHREDKNGDFCFNAPTDTSLLPVWSAIENYCLDSTESPRAVSSLFEELGRKPYGLKAGVMPILLAAVLIDRADDICIYKDGSFVPILGLEHFELLFKNPSRFAVKHFVNSGLRAQVFKAIEELVRRPDQKTAASRNSTLLGVVKPLVNFAKQLPSYTKKTKSLSAESLALREALNLAKQPDELLFSTIPEALGLQTITPGIEENSEITKEFRLRLTKGLREIQFAYDLFLGKCKDSLAAAFSVESDQLRKVVTHRASALTFKAKKTDLESFIITASDEQIDDKTWLERVLMVIGDKPVVSWGDDDVNLFETALIDWVRKFNNFESLHADVDAPGDGFDARRITLTRPSGEEVYRVVWLDRSREKDVSRIVQEIFDEKLESNPDLKEAILSKLAELILQTEKEKGQKTTR